MKPFEVFSSQRLNNERRTKTYPVLKLPKDYFESFEERLFVKISEENFPKLTGLAHS